MTGADGSVTTVESTVSNETGRSSTSALDSVRRTLALPPTGTPTMAGLACRPTVTLTTFRAVAIWLPPPSRAVATIVRTGVVEAAGTSNVAVNVGPPVAGRSTPFTVKTTRAMPSELLPCASSTSRLFSTTSEFGGGFEIANTPVANVNVSGCVNGLPAASTSALPNRSVIAAVNATTTTESSGNSWLGAKRTVALPSRNEKLPGTALLATLTRKESGVTLAGSISSENVTCSGV